MFTPAIESMSRLLGRPIDLLTAPLNVSSGKISRELEYPIWANNPFIGAIVNSNEIDPEIINDINREQDNYGQFRHMIDNICYAFNLRSRRNHPSVYLTQQEMKYAFELTKNIPRPIVALHAGGTSSPGSESDWHTLRWQELIKYFKGKIGFVQLGKRDFDHKELNVFGPQTTIREMMALIWVSDIFVGFDSFPAHVATSLKKPACVIWNVQEKAEIEESITPGFAAATMLRWSYPQNYNLMLLGEKNDNLLDLIKEFIVSKIYSIYSQKEFFALNLKAGQYI